MARLGDVCSFFSGTGFPNAYQGQKTGKYPFYKVGDISKNVLLGNRELIFSDNYIEDDTVQTIKGTVLPPKTVVFAKIGEALRLNRRAITNCYCLVDNNAMGILADNTVLDELYFYYFMCSVDLQHYCESTTVPSVRKTRIAEIEIPLPPFEEQRRIAALLDKVSDLIAKRRAQLDKLDLLVKARFVEMFGDQYTNPKGWETGTIRDVVSEVKYGTSRPAVEGGTYKYLRMGNITFDGHLDLNDLKHIDIPESEIEKCMVKKGDVLFNRTNSKELVGKTCVFDLDEPMVIAGYIIRIRVNERVLPDYLSAVLNSKYGKRTLADMCKTIVGQANINAKELQNIAILIPPVELQCQFSQFVNQVNKLASNINSSLEKLETLKKALMQQYFK